MSSTHRFRTPSALRKRADASQNRPASSRLQASLSAQAKKSVGGEMDLRTEALGGNEEDAGMIRKESVCQRTFSREREPRKRLAALHLRLLQVDAIVLAVSSLRDKQSSPTKLKASADRSG